MIHLGKYMVITGGFLIVFGVILMVAGRFNISIGSLPGDITYHNRNITVFAPFSDSKVTLSAKFKALSIAPPNSGLATGL